MYKEIGGWGKINNIKDDVSTYYAFFNGSFFCSHSTNTGGKDWNLGVVDLCCFSNVPHKTNPITAYEMAKGLFPAFLSFYESAILFFCRYSLKGSPCGTLIETKEVSGLDRSTYFWVDGNIASFVNERQ